MLLKKCVSFILFLNFFTGHAVGLTQRHALRVIESPADSNDYDLVLQRVAQQSLDNYNKFKDAFLLEQKMLQAATVGHGATGEHTKPRDNIVQAARFMGVKSQAKVQGNVDPVQIHELLYDTQQLRGPPPLALTIEEFEGVPSSDNQLQLLSSAAESVRQQATNAIADLENEVSQNDVQRHLDVDVTNTQTPRLTDVEPVAAETTVQTAKTKQAETSSPMQATEEVTLQNFPVFENLQVQQQPPPIEALIKQKREEHQKKLQECVSANKMNGGSA